MKNLQLFTITPKISKPSTQKSLILPDYVDMDSRVVGEVVEWYEKAQEVVQVSDPLMMDLDGDGVIATTGVEDGVYFDHGNDGFMERSAWVGESDGIVVYDKDGSGSIDNGSEVLGDSYVKSDGSVAVSGFDALSDFDSNGDGVVSSLDERFGDIRVLRGDGSLLTLDDVGVVSIGLNSVESGVEDESGNTVVSMGTFIRSDGTSGVVGDYLLGSSMWDSVEKDVVEVSDDVELLPDIRSMGNVYSLHQAMMRDESGELKGLIQDFVREEDKVNRRNMMTDILYRWTGADEVDVSSGGAHYDGQKLYVLEQFLAEEFRGFNDTGYPRTDAAGFLDNAYAVLSNFIYTQLEIKTHYKDVYELPVLEYDIESGVLDCNFSNIQALIDEALGLDVVSGKNLLREYVEIFLNLGFDSYDGYLSFYDYYVSKGDDYELLMNSTGKTLIYGDDSDNEITGTVQDEAVYAGDGDDEIYTRQGDDIVYGGDGDDYIDTCEDDDVVYGEGGNDTIIAGEGNDIIYGGDGNDVIDGGDDNDIIYGGNGNDVIDGGYGDDIIYGEDGDDEILGGSGDDIIYGGNGNDVIDGGYGDDIIYGGDGDDIITSTKGKDTIIGGRGDDIINASGKYGNTYEYNIGDGNDVITNDGNISYADIINFGEGITKDNILFINGGNNDLLIKFKDIDGSIRIKHGLVDMNYRIDKYKFADGTELLHNEAMESLLTLGSENDDILEDTSYNDTIYGYDGDDIITSDSGKDTIIGGRGDDIINVTWRNDNTYIYNLGDGNDIITDNGNLSGSGDVDRIIFGEGITQDNIIFSNGGDNDLLIKFINQEGSIRIVDGLVDNKYIIEKYQFTDGTELLHNEAMESLITQGTENDDILVDSPLAEKIYGYDGNDTITSTKGKDYIIGGKGDDVINVNGKNDNTYVYNLGDGDDIITDECTYSSDSDTILFGEGITQDNIIFSKGLNNDLIVSFKNQEGSITIKNWYLNSDYRIENFLFSDETVLYPDDIMDLVSIQGTNNDDIIEDESYSEKIFGYDGDDTITSGHGDDYIVAGKGDDVINVDGKNDNTYVYNLGDGNDVITDECTYSSDNDTILFGEGITQDNIEFINGGGDDLLIQFKDQDGSIRIVDGLTRGNYAIENYQFADGSSYTYNQIKELIETRGTNGDDVITDASLSEKIYGYDGDDTITSSGGDDYIVGGKGDDVITGSQRSNTYEYNLGDGNDTITDYCNNSLTSCYDTIIFGEGISKDDVLFSSNGEDLIISFDNQEGSITVKNSDSYQYRIENYQFSDGSILTYNQIKDTISTSTQAVSDYDVNMIVQDMASYGCLDSGMVCVEDNINREELINLVMSN